MATITPTGQACGAVVTDIDLRAPLTDTEAAQLRTGLDTHHVLAFPEQPMTNAQLEQFSTAFGALGTDPFFVPVEGSDHVAEVRREAEETTALFADNWHSDWSFLASPPVATCLLGVEIPPVGGDTLFANQHLAYERLPADLKAKVDGLRAKHTSQNIYGKGSKHDPEADGAAGLSMDIVVDKAAMHGEHPLVRMHEGNGRPAFYSTIGYIQGIVGMTDAEARDFMVEIYRHQTADDIVYRHTWEPNMCVVWDNRSVLHKATGGYEGHRRVLRRTTIVASAAS